MAHTRPLTSGCAEVAAVAFGVAAGVALLQLAQLVGVACNGIGYKCGLSGGSGCYGSGRGARSNNTSAPPCATTHSKVCCWVNVCANNFTKNSVIVQGGCSSISVLPCAARIISSATSHMSSGNNLKPIRVCTATGRGGIQSKRHTSVIACFAFLANALSSANQAASIYCHGVISVSIGVRRRSVLPAWSTKYLPQWLWCLRHASL